MDLVHSSPRQDAAPFQPHDEIMAFPYEIVVERGSVAPSVVHVHDRALAPYLLSTHDVKVEGGIVFLPLYMSGLLAS